MVRRSLLNKKPYQRNLRVSQLVREVLAESLIEFAQKDERCENLCVTDVLVSSDLRHACVYLDTLTEAQAEALLELRPMLQRQISRTMRIKKTPILSFQEDRAIKEGEKIDALIRKIRDHSSNIANESK